MKKLIPNAVEASQRAIKAQPNDPVVRYTAALTYFSAEQWPEAEASLTTVITINPKAWDAYELLGKVYAARQKKDDARKILQSLLEKNPAYVNKDGVQNLMDSL
ncbi:MAG: tetratricopeptide repeat protein [Chloroflexota bacterium]